MKNYSYWLSFFFLSTTVSAQIRPYQPDVDVQHYTFSLTLNDQNNQVEGETKIRFRSAKPAVWLDLIGKQSDTAQTGMTVQAVALKGTGQPQPLKFTHRDNRIYIDLPPATGTDREVMVTYSGIAGKGFIISKNKFGERTFFGDNWPNNARNWLPVVDHPSDKATCEFIVRAPAQYRVIANGALKEESDLPDGRKLTHWIEHTPIPTKVMVMGAARFAVENRGEVAGIPVQSWVYPKDREKGFFDYSPGKAVLTYFNRQIGPYSYEKLANVQSTTLFGGMENASCIFYNEKAIVGKPSIRIESLVAHEIAHQWFGNSVTEKDWAHVWLSEGFATYFAALYLEHQYGPDTLNQVMNDAKATVFKFADRKPRGTIVDTTTDLSQILNANSYQKGSWVLHMLRYEVGDALFWKGIQTYYRRYRNSNAQTADFQAIMEQSAGRRLDRFFRQWLYQPGYPELDWQWTYDKSRKQLTIQVSQMQSSATPFELPLVFSIQNQEGKEVVRTQRLLLNRQKQNFTVSVKGAPAQVVLDPDAHLLIKAAKAK